MAALPYVRLMLGVSDVRAHSSLREARYLALSQSSFSESAAMVSRAVKLWNGAERRNLRFTPHIHRQVQFKCRRSKRDPTNLTGYGTLFR